MRIRNLIFLLYICFTQDIIAQNYSGFPGIVINHSPAASEIYLGSPSIAILPNGDYLASHDIFGPAADSTPKVYIFLSKDKGKTWTKQSEIENQFWSGLFVCYKDVYLLGTSGLYGDIIIRRSTDRGKTWTNPVDSLTGIIRKGEYHCAPTPVLFKNRRIYKGFEKKGKDKPGEWCSSSGSFIMSSKNNSDLLNSGNWRFTDMKLKPKSFPGTGWLETNAVYSPNGRIAGITRMHTEVDNIAGFYELTEDERRIDESTLKTINLPGAAKKFSIRYDYKSMLYWSLVNFPLDTLQGINDVERMRSVLALVSSPDLEKWTIRYFPLYSANVKKHGFQYVDFLFEDKDIIFVSRTAYDDGLGGANDCHNSNFISFHRIKNFREIELNKVTFDVDKYLPPKFDINYQIYLSKIWKFSLGDNPEWSKPDFDDSFWKNIETGKTYESQGYDYNGFSWYRLKVIIPSTLKIKNRILLIDLGKIDDGDMSYLNGNLIGINAGYYEDIKKGGWAETRIYSINTDSPFIQWDKENTIAVRVWDKGNDGGMYKGNYRIGLRR